MTPACTCGGNARAGPWNGCTSYPSSAESAGGSDGPNKTASHNGGAGAARRRSVAWTRERCEWSSTTTCGSRYPRRSRASSANGRSAPAGARAGFARRGVGWHGTGRSRAPGGGGRRGAGGDSGGVVLINRDIITVNQLVSSFGVTGPSAGLPVFWRRAEPNQ
jgi:hypothetical protein